VLTRGDLARTQREVIHGIFAKIDGGLTDGKGVLILDGVINNGGRKATEPHPASSLCGGCSIAALGE
jgi:hypothetical protein